MLNVSIGGVPEHFNLPWYLTLKNKEYHEYDINLRWKDFYGGTGAMNAALRSGEIDMAVILTEGIIKDIIDGNQSKIVQKFIETPLIWGVHVADSSRYQQVKDLKGTKAAISRYGSGSHLMAYLYAKKHLWNLEEDLKFEVIKNLDGAIEGLTNEKADYFLWEKFTTKPIVDQGIFRCIDTYPTPWPCFVIAASDSFIKNHAKSLKHILKIINQTTFKFKNIQDIDQILASRYNQKLEDIQEWLLLTEWSQCMIKKDTINSIQKALYGLDIIHKVESAEKFMYDI